MSTTEANHNNPRECMTAHEFWEIAYEHTKSMKYEHALYVMHCTGTLPCPLVWNIPGEKWVVYIGRTNAYKYLRDAGYHYDEYWRVWRKGERLDHRHRQNKLPF